MAGKGKAQGKGKSWIKPFIAGKEPVKIDAGSESAQENGEGISEQVDVHVPSIVTGRSADLEALVGMYEGFLRGEDSTSYWHRMKSQYTGQEIHDFADVMEEYSLLDSFKGSGTFLSLLLARCDEDLTLEPRGFDFLGNGYNKGRTIEFDGSVGDYVGRDMNFGKIVVKGSAGKYAGHRMIRGELVIRGDVGDWLGNQMSGGIILVYGNRIGNGIASKMDGGAIYLESPGLNLETAKNSVSDEMTKGKVYLRDKIIAFK